MTRYAGAVIPPAVVWEFGDLDGEAFEEVITEHLQELYSEFADVVAVEQTPRSRDYGRDIIITAQRTIDLFGTEIPERAGRPTKIYIECKLRTGDRLEPEFFFDFSQFTDTGNPDYYFLVTTAGLTPNVHHKAVRECAARNVVFRLIDRVLLAEYVTKNDLPIGLRAPVVLPEDVVVEYQVVPSFYPKERRIDVYLVIWNYALSARSFHVYLSTSDKWRIVEGPTNVERIAQPRSALQFQLIAQRLTADETDLSLDLGVSVENDRREIHVTAPHLELAFKPVLVGTQHYDEVHHLRTIIDENKGLAIVSITGRAGVGKSRIVDDALEPRMGKANIDFEPIFFGMSGRFDDLSAAMRRLKIQHPSGRRSAEPLITHLLSNAGRRGRRQVILLEDLHHARKPVLDAIKRFVLKPPKPAYPVTIVLTGRNDHTYPNDEYYSLLEVLAAISRRDVVSVEMLPLVPEDTLRLIRSTLREAPEVVVERIRALSENVPFYVIQAIEYLLESGLAYLAHRSEVGVPHLPSFAAKEHIPDSIDKLYALRLSALGKLPHGRAMLDFLVTQSFFGLVVSTTVMDEALDPDAAEEILRTLIARRFLGVRATNGSVTFAHENLLAVMRARARDPEYRERAGKLVLSRPRLFELLDDLERGEVHFLTGAFADALTQFSRLVDAVDRTDNFSSEDLDVRFFRFIDAAFESELQCEAKPDRLKKMLLAKAYMGIHNYPLLIGVRACDAALAQLSRVKLPDERRGITELEIRQLQAHGLLNMGETMKASGIMFELDQLLRSTTTLPPAPELLFDIYDRLQELYKKWNHETLARSYGRMARRVAEESGNHKLLACHAITEAGMDIYRNVKSARTAAKWSYDECTKPGSAYRLKVYTRLSTYVAEALTDQTPATWERLLKHAKLLYREAAVKKLSDSLMRVQLFIATLTYLTRPGDLRTIETSEKYVRDGLGACAFHGKGLFSWLLYNLAGTLADARRGDREEVWEFFNSALRDLDQQGLLFVGRKDFTYPTMFVISNIVRFRSHFERPHALEILGRVMDYDSPRTEETREAALRNVLSKSHIFFRTTRRFTCLTDPKHGYWLPLL